MDAAGINGDCGGATAGGSPDSGTVLVAAKGERRAAGTGEDIAAVKGEDSSGAESGSEAVSTGSVGACDPRLK